MDKLKQSFFIKDLDDISQLDEIKTLFNKIDLELYNLNSFILDNIKNVLINLKELQIFFSAFLKMNKNVQNEKQNCLENIKHKMNLYFEQISEILENQNFIKIKELNNQLLVIINKKFNNEIELSNNSYNFINSYNKFCDNYKDNSEENNNNSIFCSTCHASKAQFFCKEGKIMCKNCYDDKNNMNKHSHISQNKKENISEKEIEMENFLNSLKNIIKSILIRSNILYNEKESIIDTNIKNNKIIQRLSFKYPSIDNINDFDSQIKFLKDINNILINVFGQTDINLSSFKNSEINNDIFNIIEYFNFENSSQEISGISNLSFTEDDYESKTINNLYYQYEEEDNKSENIFKENVLSVSQLETIFKKPLCSICRFNSGFQFNEEYMTGFFCNIKYKKGVIPVLFTAYLDVFFDKIELISYNNKFQLNLKNSKRIIYSNKKNKISIIELKKDEIQSSYFELDMSLISNENKNDFNQRKIYSLYYSNSIKDFCFSFGLGRYIKKHVLYHTCPINEFCNGAPIINFINNKIIGINYNTNNKKINKARLLKDSIKNFISKII